MSTPPPPSPQQTALLLIDIQDGFLTSPLHWGSGRSNSLFEANTTSILSSYRNLLAASPTQHKIIHIQHSSTSPLSPLHKLHPLGGFSIQKFVEPRDGELVVEKRVNSGFIGTGLEGVLREHFGNGLGAGDGSGKLFLVGLSTDHCVSTTTRMAGNLGVCGVEGEVVLVEDATAAWGKGGWDAEVVHAVNVESLKEFASVKKTKEVLEEWKKL